MFTYKRHKDYIELLYNGSFICSCDNWNEVEQEQENYLINRV